MSTATDLLGLGITRSYTPWWHELDQDGHGIRVTVDDPDHPEGSGVTLTRTLTAAQIHEAFTALAAASKLCCGGEMRREGYGYGCAEDADLILQHATFGEVVYG